MHWFVSCLFSGAARIFPSALMENTASPSWGTYCCFDCGSQVLCPSLQRSLRGMSHLSTSSETTRRARGRVKRRSVSCFRLQASFIFPAAKHVLPHYVPVCEAKAADTDPGVISLTRHCREQTRRDHPHALHLTQPGGNSFSPHHLWLKAAYHFFFFIFSGDAHFKHIWLRSCTHTHTCFGVNLLLQGHFR